MIYVVTSLRQYENDEMYFGADMVAASLEEAQTYIELERNDVMAEYEGQSCYVSSHDGISGSEYILRTDSHLFVWRIDVCKWKEEIA